MESSRHTIIYNELMHQHGTFFKHVMRKTIPYDEIPDTFQEFSIHFYHLIQERYDTQPELFASYGWLKTITHHFCISEIRKRQSKKNQVWVNTTSEKVVIEETPVYDQEELINQLFEAVIGSVNKRDALVLKMKYCYDKPSKYISKKMGIKHVDVYIARIKERVRRQTGNVDLDEWLNSKS
jgi:RNA polymerase sigma factor (sigma-70 family)